MAQKCSVPTVGTMYKEIDKVQESVDTYVSNFADMQEKTTKVDKEKIVKTRTENAKSMTETFYILATDFYEYGYGQSFHFAPIMDGISFAESIAEYERSVGKTLGAKPGMKILDVGCGVGGPGREIAKYSGANIVGLNCNDYQLARARKHTSKLNLDHLCTYINSDFCDMADIEDNSYDAVFSFEATCHAKDPVIVYREIARVLKPGGLYVDATWALTDVYDPQNPQHVKVKDEVCYGNSLPELRTEQEILAAIRKGGLEVIEFRDLIQDSESPWYKILESQGYCSLKNFRMSKPGRMTTHVILIALEALSVVPKGTVKVHSVLDVAATSLVEAGKLGIFTPMFKCLTRKPLQD